MKNVKVKLARGGAGGGESDPAWNAEPSEGHVGRKKRAAPAGRPERLKKRLKSCLAG
jgi:hypothetical protein